MRRYLLLATTVALTAASSGSRVDSGERDVSTSGLATASIAPAMVVNRLERFEALDHKRARTEVTLEVIVLGPEGREHGELTIYHDQYRRIKKLDGRVFDESGKTVRKLKKEHIEDVSAVTGESLYEEGRIRTARLYHTVYPYRVEYSYELEHDGLLNWPAWYPGDQSIPTLRTSFEIVAPRS
ncbi:MAG: DUF3857 domain-containing protein, partial [Rhodothermales bacterium]|nr:DUF3857 domain-containing protein [Rhodothermales bacterium]